ncbi:AfsA-related hotdog domain-containing protein [Actinophytocola sediminis]
MTTLFHSPDELVGDGVLVRDVDLVSAVWGGRLEVAPEDRYHFDHPLDHVPGMALVGGLLELVRRSGAADLGRTGRRMTLEVTFPAFCELEEQVYLQAVCFPPAESTAEVTLSLLAEQTDRVVCEADLSLSHDPHAAPRRAGPATLTRLPADPAAVNRRRPENVLVTGLETRGDRRLSLLVPVAATHLLAVEPGRPHLTELLIDAARQFLTMICHLEHGHPDSTRLIMFAINADLPCGLAGDVQLRWSVIPPGRGRQTLTAELVTGDPDGAPCGSVSFEYYAATPAGYRRLRGEVRA